MFGPNLTVLEAAEKVLPPPNHKMAFMASSSSFIISKQSIHQGYTHMRASGMFPIAWIIVAISATRSAYCSHETLAPNAYLFETFDSNDWSSRWAHSEDEKYQGKFTTSLIKTVETVAVESSNAVLKVQSLKRRNKSKRFCKIFIFTRSDSGHACPWSRSPSPNSSMESQRY